MKQESIIRGQFEEVSSAGGVGRKYREGSKGKRIPDQLRWSRCWCPLLSLCHQKFSSLHPAKQGMCLHLVSPGKFLPPGAPEESARKVPKASAYKDGSVGVDVGVRYCYGSIAIKDHHPATLPNKERAHFWSVQGSFFRRGRRKKVPGRFQRWARTKTCEIIKEMRIDGKIRSSGVSSRKFLPSGRRKKVPGRFQRQAHT